MKTMKAVVFKCKDRIAVEEVPKPVPRAGEAVIRITTTTICGTDVHIVKLVAPYEVVYAGLGDQKIVTSVLKLALYPDAAHAAVPRETVAAGALDE
jgi:threonine dehydrogenase-like Zn-dependent dehydrogenase